MFNTLNIGQKSLVDGLLVRYPTARDLFLLWSMSVLLRHARVFASYLCLLALLEESFLTSLFLGLLRGEVLRRRNLVYLVLGNTGKVDLIRCGYDVSRIDASQRDTVDLKRASDKQNALLKGLQEDNSFASEPASE